MSVMIMFKALITWIILRFNRPEQHSKSYLLNLLKRLANHLESYRVSLRFVYTLINLMRIFFMTENFSQKVMFYKVVSEIMTNFVEHHFL
jgi:hypothetical protein